MIDTTGQECPIPLLRAKSRMRSMAAGDRLVVVATDPDVGVDFGAWAAVAGHELSEREVDGHLVLTVVKA